MSGGLTFQSYPRISLRILTVFIGTTAKFCWAVVTENWMLGKLSFELLFGSSSFRVLALNYLSLYWSIWFWSMRSLSTFFINLKWHFLLALLLSNSTSILCLFSSSYCFYVSSPSIFFRYSSLEFKESRSSTWSLFKNCSLNFRSSKRSWAAWRFYGLSTLVRKLRRSALSLFDKTFAATGIFCFLPAGMVIRPLFLGSAV